MSDEPRGFESMAPGQQQQTWELRGKQIFKPYFRPTESETLAGPSNLCFNK